MDPITMAQLGMMAGAGIGSMFSNYKNPADAANPYFNKMPQYFDPYFKAGTGAIPTLQNQYSGLVNDPSSMLNKIGGGYQQSPGFQFALQQALQGAGNAQAAGGMAGSPQHEQMNMRLATNLANQDFNQWLQNALGLYGAGIGGYEKLYGGGLKAGEDLASILANQAKLAYEGQNAENQHSGGGMGALFGGLGGMLGGSKKFGGIFG